MALSLQTVGNAAGSGGPFLAQVQAALQSTVTAILTESSATQDYVVRRKFAQKSALNIVGVASAIAVAVATQIQAANSAKYTDLSAIADADVTTAISGIFTQQAYANILPS